jgi:hypothetical protein
MKLTKILETSINSKLDTASKQLLKYKILYEKMKDVKINNGADKQNAIDTMEDYMNTSGISSTAVKEMADKLQKMSNKEIEIIANNFQSMSMEQYISGGWKIFKDFFEVKGSKVGTGRGELMAVMAIEGASSGGTEEKDLKVDGVGTYEVKEDPDNIRMAKSGFAGLFGYTAKIKDFYKLLDGIDLNNPSNDKVLLQNLKLAFNNASAAEEVFKVLTLNFRGDGFKSGKTDKEAGENPVTENNFFVRSQVAAEIPTGVIQLQFEGFEKLKVLRGEILKNSDLIKNAKMLVKFKDVEAEYWISGDDAEELKNAKPNAEVSIKKGVNANQKEFKVFMYNLIELFKHPYATNPISISDDFSDRKNKYFGEVKGILYYMEGDPKPYIGQKNEFVVYAISQNMGKLRMKRNNEVGWIANQT